MIAKIYMGFLCALFLYAVGLLLYQQFLTVPPVKVGSFLHCFDGQTWDRCRTSTGLQLRDDEYFGIGCVNEQGAVRFEKPCREDEKVVWPAPAEESGKCQ